MRLILLIILSLSGSIGLADSQIGFLFYNANTSQVQTNLEGDFNSFKLAPGLYFSKNFELSTRWSIRPNIGFVFDSSHTENYRQTHLLVLANWIYKIRSQYLFKIGIGLDKETISSDRSVINLDNGSSTKNFFTPGGSRISYNMTTQIGFEFKHKQYGFDFQSIISELFSDKRNIDLIIGLKYYL